MYFMKRTHHLFLILASAVVLNSGCSKDLNLTPISSITTNSFWKTQEDARGGATGMYVSLKATANDILRSEIRSEVYEGGISGTGADYAELQANAITPQAPGYPGWLGYYRTINDANLILKYVPNINFTDPAEKNKILAEAYATRAYVYYVMTKVWGDLIIRTEPVESSDPSVTQRARSPRTEVFARIKEDIESALSLFPNNNFPTGRIRWSAPAVNALKADVYLFTGKRMNGGQADFNTALTATNDAETAQTSLLPNFADIFRYDNKGNQEYLMAIRHDVIEGGLFHHFTWFGSGLPSNVSQRSKDLILPTGQGIGLLVPTELVRDQFVEEDSRRNASFHEVYLFDQNGDSTYFTSVDLKHRGVVQTGNRLFTDDAILYRLADVILMRAEAKNALGQDPTTEINRIYIEK